MRPWTLRSQSLIIIVFLWLYALGGGLAYWIQDRAHGELSRAFQHDLAVLARLPRLRDQLHGLDLATSQYLLSGEARWLEARRKALAEVRQTADALAELRAGGEEGAILSRLDRQLAAYLSLQNRWIEVKRSGRLSPAEAQRLMGRRQSFDELTGELIRVKDANIETLERRRLEVEAASRVTLGLILLMGMLACAWITFFLSRYIVRPVEVLHAWTARWTLGSSWTPDIPRASPEIQEMAASMRGLADRVNAQYEKERELAGLKARLVSMVSHEFNNVLSTMRGYMWLLEREEKKRAVPGRGEYYRILDSNIRALTMTARNLLDMGRFQEGKLTIDPGKVEVRRLVAETLESLSVLVQRKELSILQDFPAEVFPVAGDPEMLSLVLSNLIGNAIKYTPEKGTVTVGAAPEAGGLRLYCQDTGIGISAEDQGRIFSGYYRTEEGRKVAKGFGLGLALAFNIVEAHGSRLEVSSSPGKGARFSFLLNAWKDPSLAAA
ncbi:MAG: hypothetical protein HY924_00120 [Elusimicrobia bacterium]|nr:hypothetical protein [Elusimicrobiota bacterium]